MNSRALSILRLVLVAAGVLALIILSALGQFSYISNILSQIAVLAIIALGQTFVIILGGIDLSVGSVSALIGAFTAGFIVNNGLHPMVAMLLALGIGIAIGIFNGTLVHVFKIPPFVATLSMLAIARGATLVYTNGAPIFSDHPFFTGLSGSLFAGISPAIILMIALYALGHITLRYTPYGLRVYAVGNNPNTARLSGIAVGRVTIGAYTICSACAAIGGIVLASRLWSAQPNAAFGFELDAIAVVVLGGASLFGGIGAASGTFIGVLLLGVLSNGMNLLHIAAYTQRVIWGVILIAVVGFDIQVRRGALKRKRR